MPVPSPVPVLACPLADLDVADLDIAWIRACAGAHAAWRCQWLNKTTSKFKTAGSPRSEMEG